MAGPRPIRWLHLSDLHLGCRGEALWWQVQEVLEKSVREMVKRLGPPDLLLLSGDLTNTGDSKEFKRVDRLLHRGVLRLPQKSFVQGGADGRAWRVEEALRARGEAKADVDISVLG